MPPPRYDEKQTQSYPISSVFRVLYIAPQIKGDFRSFFCTASGYGTIGVRDGKPFVETKTANIPFIRLEYAPK